MIDPISDMLTRIRNGVKVRHEKVVVPHSKIKAKILDVLKREGYIEDYKKNTQGNKEELEVTLKYENGVSKISDLQKISKASQRRYVDRKHIPQSKQGLGLMIISTSQGLMSDKEARKKGVGGEVVCEVW